MNTVLPLLYGEYLIPLVLLVVLFALAFKSGTTRAISLCLSVPISLVVMNLMKVTIGVSALYSSLQEGAYGSLIIFGGIVVLAYFLLNKLLGAQYAFPGLIGPSLITALGGMLFFLSVFTLLPGIESLVHLTGIPRLFATQYALYGLLVSLGIFSYTKQGYL
jgi:hypothetical protein